MKLKSRPAFLNSLLITCSALLLPSAAQSQILYWAAPVNGLGNRDGAWSPTIPNWSPFPGAPASMSWSNTGNAIAYFTNPEGATVNTSTLIRLRGIYSDTVAPVTITGVPPLSFNGIASITVVNVPLFINSTISNLGGTLTKSGTGLLAIGGNVTTNALIIQEGLVSLSGGNLVNSAEVRNSSVLIMDDSDTVSKYIQSSGALTGSGTLTATNGATLSSGTIAGKLSANTTVNGDVEVSGTIGGGSLTVSAGTLNLTGTSTHTLIEIAAGAELVNASGKLDATETSIKNLGTLTMRADDTIHDYVQGIGGELKGTGTLTVDKAAFLDGGTVSGKLLGGTVVRGDVLVSGTLGGGDLKVYAGTLSLEGSSTNDTVYIEGGAKLLDNGDLSDQAVVHNAGSLTLVKDERIDSYSHAGSALLDGSGVLTATRGATLSGGTVAGSLIAGDTYSQGNVLVTGSISGNHLYVPIGTLTLEGKSTHDTVEITSSGLFSNLIVNGELAGKTVATNQGTLTVNRDNTIASYEQTGIAMLDGSGTLSTTEGATLKGGLVTGGLAGNVNVLGNVEISGSLGEGTLAVESGVLSMSGTSGNQHVRIGPGASLISNGGFSDHANVVIGGSWDSGTETLSTLELTSSGEISGNSVITATNGATFHGGSILGELNADVLSEDYVSVSGSMHGTSLTVKSGQFWLSGTSSHSMIKIDGGASLFNYGTMNPDAVLNNAGAYHGEGMDQDLGALINSGDVSVGSLTVANQTVFNGGRLQGTLHALGGATLNDGTVIEGELVGDMTTHGGVAVSGTLGGSGELRIENGILDLTGTSTHDVTTIASGATLRNSGNLGDTSHITNFGTLSVNAGDTIGRLFNNGGLVDGSGRLIVSGPVLFNGGELAGKLVATSGAVLNGGTLISGELLGQAESRGDVTISGSTGSGNLVVADGSLKLTGTVDSFTHIKQGAGLIGNGRIKSILLNEGKLTTLSEGGRTLKIDGSLANLGLVSMTVTDAGHHDQIKVGGTASLGGSLLVTNNGAGLESGEVAELIKADSFTGGFEGFQTEGFENPVIFDDSSGRLIGMASGRTMASKRYLNLNATQTDIYLSLYEDAVEAGEQNVMTGGDSTKRASRAAMAADEGDTIEFTSGLSDGDAQLVDALNLATFTDPGSIYQPVINRLSPEVHRGMADYTEQATRSHVREVVDAAPVSRIGKTQIFATAHSSMEGVDSGRTEAGYDLQMTGFTSGARHDFDKLTRIGGLAGWDDGTIQGELVDTEGHGFTLGAFASRVLDEKRDTTLTASLAYGGYDFNATRHSFQGDVEADNISSDALEFALGARTTIYQGRHLLVSPHSTLRFINGSVDGFEETGNGVPLRVGGQDVHSALLDLGVNVEYKPVDDVTLIGNIGCMEDFGDSGESINASFAATGPGGRPFSASAPGIDDDAIVLGLGIHYDLNDQVRANMNYRGEIRAGSQDAHNFGIGFSIGF